MAYAMVALNVVLLVGGQVLWKQAVVRSGGFNAGLALQPGVWAGGLVYVVASVIWLAVLARLRLSIAYPLQATAYGLGALAAHWVFEEAVPPLRWAGIVVILLGVAMVAVER